MPRQNVGVNLSRQLSDATTKSYSNILDVLTKQGITDLTDTKRVLGAIKINSKTDNETSLNTQRAKLSGIIYRIFKLRDDSRDIDEIHKYDRVITTYQAEVARIWDAIDKQEKAKEAQGSREDPFVEWSRLKDLYKTEGLAPVETAMLALFDLFPPRRRQDYPFMKVVTRTPTTAIKETNWFVMNKERTSAKFVFRQYKTRGLYESQEFPVPDALFKVLKDAGVLEVGKHLLTTSTGRGYSPDSFGQAFAKLNARLLNGTKATVNTYRHSFITDYLLKNPPYSDKAKVAEMMAHSVGEQAKYDKRESWGVALCPCPTGRVTRSTLTL